MLDGEKGECDLECTLFASLHGKRAHPLCSLGIGTPIIYRTKDTDIYLKGWMEVCACPSTKPPPLEGGILPTQPYAWVSMNSALVCGFLSASARPPSTQQFHIPLWRIVTLAFLYTPAQKMLYLVMWQLAEGREKGYSLLNWG